MEVIHGHWLVPVRADAEGRFAVWAESSAEEPRKGRGRKRIPAHPYAAPSAWLSEHLPRLAQPFDAAPGSFILLLPRIGRLPWPSTPLVQDWGAFQGAEPQEPGPFQVEGLLLEPAAALVWLSKIPTPSDLPPDLALADDLIFWATSARWGLELLAEQRYLPSIEAQPSQTFAARWRLVFDHPGDAGRLSRLVQAMPPAARAALRSAALPSATLPGDLKENLEPVPAQQALLDFLNRAVDAAIRERCGPRLYRQSSEGVSSAWLNALFAPDPTISGPYFSLNNLAKANRTWRRRLQMAGEAAFRVCLRLNVPAAPEDSWRLEYLLQARDDPSLLVEAEQVWRARGKSLQQLGRRFENPQENLLGALGYAAQLFPPLEASLHTRRPSGADLDSQQAYRFLREAAPLLEQSGFGVLVPPWWNRRGARLGARLKINSPGQAQSNAGQLSLDKLVSYNWEIVLGEQTLSREEFKALVKLKMPLVKIRGQWVVLDPRQIEAAIRFWEKQRAERQMDTLEAVSWGLNPEGEVGGLPVEAVEVSGWLAELLEELQNEERLELQESPPELAGELRPYQQRGFSWLAFMRRWGLGACLADDMGLGKTIQAIALFLHARQPGQRWGATPALPLETPPNGEQSQAPPNGQQTPGIPPGEQALVVCPTSVAGNWQREIERFAPQLKVLLHHGGQRAEGEAFLEQARQHDVVITSYGLARRDVEALEQLQWGCLVLDEAQNIKNPSARQTQAVRRIPARFRLALTGTPVENRLLELWSIMQFLNPGYLGSQKKFRSQFGLPIERYHDPQASQELRQQVGPFILRRLKTNPAILQDLPEKMEMKVYCNLTEEQASLYQVVVDESLASVEAAEAEEDRIQRSGLVLSMLLKLKQVCNHPALFLGDQSGLAGRSGKLERLEEMLEEALSVGDKALIFTQFASMGGLLKDHLQERFGREVLFLHGGTPRPQRERMLARFQDGPTAPPVFILSLKAGGVGLNLTAANHVFHFDRWWNPAVEQQATDRAFRIGQTRNVQVHKFICTGTLEENIDLLIEGKKALAESVIQSSESWLTELSTQELRQVIRLRPEAVGVA